jgi:hypothetical protein
MLLNVIYKIPSSVILERLKEYSEEILGEYQCGFRPQRTTDQLFVVRQILEKCYAHDTDHHVFIDFMKTFDRINQKKTARITTEFWDTQKDRTARENDM